VAFLPSSGQTDGEAIPQLASDLVQAVRKTRTVAQALQNASWISGISGSLSVIALTQYVLCGQASESVAHLLISCVFSREPGSDCFQQITCNG
jgi:hypothetical protein